MYFDRPIAKGRNKQSPLKEIVAFSQLVKDNSDCQITWKAQAGHSPRDLADDMNKLRANNFSSFWGQKPNVGITMCFINGLIDKSTGWKYVGEPEFLEAQMTEMFDAISEFSDRPCLVLGGSARLFGIADTWDILVNKYFKVAQARGILVITGEKY